MLKTKSFFIYPNTWFKINKGLLSLGVTLTSWTRISFPFSPFFHFVLFSRNFFHFSHLYVYIYFFVRVSPLNWLGNISKPSLDKDISSKIAQRVTLAVGSWNRAFLSRLSVIVYDLSLRFFFLPASRFSPGQSHETLFLSYKLSFGTIADPDTRCLRLEGTENYFPPFLFLIYKIYIYK